jgi:PST family polysaccharide transporter
MERRFLHSTVASYASLGVRTVINFVARLLLARLILPVGHGLYEEALNIVLILGVVRDLGLVHHLIRDERRPYGTVFGFTLGSSLLLTVALVLCAPLFSFLNPELPRVLRVFAPWLLLDGLMLVPRTFFERELRLGRMVAPEIARGLTMAVVSVGLASLGYGVWSLVYGELTAALALAILVWLRAGREMQLSFSWRELPGLLKKSRFLFFISATAMFVARVDPFIVEVFSDTAMVGQYVRAYGVILLVPMIVAPRSLLPALVAYRDDPPRFFEAFRFGVVLLLSFQVTAAYFLFFNAHKVIDILLGPNWGPAVPLLQVLCFVPLLDISAGLGGEVLKVRYEDRVWFLTMLVNLACLLTFGSLFTMRWGAYGMAWANFLPLGNLILIYRLRGILGKRFRKLLRNLLFVYLCPLPLFLFAAWIAPADSWGRFGASVLAAVLAGAILGARFYRPFSEFFAGRVDDRA